MSEWEIIRRQVAIGGVIHIGTEAAGGCVLKAQSSEVGESMTETKSRADGSFYFLDLPNGKWTLTASQAGLAVAQDVTILRAENGDMNVQWVEMQLGQS